LAEIFSGRRKQKKVVRVNCKLAWVTGELKWGRYTDERDRERGGDLESMVK
jgi:hypothetical protein